MSRGAESLAGALEEADEWEAASDEKRRAITIRERLAFALEEWLDARPGHGVLLLVGDVTVPQAIEEHQRWRDVLAAWEELP